MCADLLPCVYSIMEPQRQQLMVNNRKYQADGGEAEGGHGDVRCWADVNTSAVKPSIGSTTGCTITEKAPTMAFTWLKAATTAFTFKTLLRYYAKRALTPR